MTVFAYDMSKLNTEQLLSVYCDENQKKGSKLYPEESTVSQLMRVENALLSYLREDFFRQPDAFYALLDDGDGYCAAARLEPFKDGMLLEGVATLPDQRRRGYATKLLLDILIYLRTTQYTRVYAHVLKNNIPSLKLHEKCGFCVISDCATLLDGTISNQYHTLRYDR